MRAIKFRVWDKTQNQFLDQWDEIDPVIGLDGQVHLYSRENKGWDNKDWMLGHLVLQQFTGLLDKNGKEIFEGDIVDVKYLVGKNTKEQFQGEVRFGVSFLSDTSEAPQHQSTCFYIKPNDERENVGLIPNHNYCDGRAEIEIISNVFENPELLK